MSDEQLMERVVQDDREALAELFRRYQGPLYNFFLRSIGRPEDAEDLAMETLLRVFETAPRFRGGSFRAWIYRLALNILRDRARRLRYRPECLASSIADAWSALEDQRQEGRPEEMALRGDLAARVRDAIRRLPEKERTALILREYQQLSYAEISTALEVSLPSVKMLLLRGREKVRKRLGAGCPAGAAEAVEAVEAAEVFP
jgi:RNA polymerase sigma-70 factor, ECF subfamily